MAFAERFYEFETSGATVTYPAPTANATVDRLIAGAVRSRTRALPEGGSHDRPSEGVLRHPVDSPPDKCLRGADRRRGGPDEVDDIVRAGGEDGGHAEGPPGLYEAVVSTTLVQRIIEAGFDVADIQLLANQQARITLVLKPNERIAVRKMGVNLELWRNDNGLTATQLAKQQSTAGFKVWRDNDGPNGFDAYAHAIAAANPDLLKLEVIGRRGDQPERRARRVR